MTPIDQFRTFVQAKLVMIRVQMGRRPGEGVDDALWRGDKLYAEQEATRAVGYMLDNALDLAELEKTVAAGLPTARGLELEELQTAQRMIAEFKESQG